jgi:tRNA threonylcarbamoyl adenosine modification protein YeaZ
MAGIALVRDGQCLAKESWLTMRGNPGVLVKNIACLRARAALPWEQLDLVLVGCGPGQYAGLRISVTAAKAIQLPGNGAVRGISSAYALLAQARTNHPHAKAIIACGDARRNHLWLFTWLAMDPGNTPAMQCLSRETFAHMRLPEETLVLSPDYQRLQKDLHLPRQACWIEHDVFPDPETMIHEACRTHALLSTPEIQYVHPPVFA